MKMRLGLIAALLTVAILQQGARAEEPDDGRVHITIRAADPNGERLYFRWRQTEGPATRIQDTEAAAFDKDTKKWVSDTYFVPTEPGKYVFEVEVRNESGGARKSVIVREVLPPTPPPTAVAGKDQDKTAGEVVVINGIGSRAAAGRDIMQWEWKYFGPEKFKLDAKLMKERQFDFKAQEPGNYHFELRVFDGKRWSEASRMLVKVKPATLPPVIEPDNPTPPKELAVKPNVVEKPALKIKAVAAPGKTIKVGETIVLDGSQSVVDVNENPEFYWRQIKGPIMKTLNADRTKPYTSGSSGFLNYPVYTCVPTIPGDYTFILEITSGKKGAEQRVESDPVVFSVKADNLHPVARVFVEKKEVEVGELVTIDGNASSDPEKSALTYVWGPIPGKRAPRNWIGFDGPIVRFRPEEEGEYTVALVVNDGQLASEPYSVTITATAPNQVPTVRLQKRYEAVVGEALIIEAQVIDAERDTYEVMWTCVEPPTTKIPVEFSKHKTLRFLPKKTGTYVFRIVVTDQRGRTIDAQTMVGVRDAVNIPPTAVIDGPKSVLIGDSVRLSGARSADPENKALTYMWKQDIGPKAGSRVPGENERDWSFKATEAGKYVFSLAVFDGVNWSDAEKFEVNVPKPDRAPVAKIVASALKFPLNQAVTLDGSASIDPENEKIAFKWTKIDGGAKGGDADLDSFDQAKVTVRGTKPGPVKVQLTITTGPLVSTADVVLNVLKSNTSPVAKIGTPSKYKIAIGETLTLDAGGSSDPDKDRLTFKWSKVGGEGDVKISAGDRDRISVAGSAAGPVKLELVVNDGFSDSPAEAIELTVLKSNVTPIAKAKARESVISVGQQTVIDGSGSSDPDGDKLTYSWRKEGRGDIEMRGADSNQLTIIAVKPGAVRIELVVSDGNASSVTDVTLNINKSNAAPVAKIPALSFDRVSVGQRVTIDGSSSSDPDKDKLTYKWRKVEGDGEVKLEGADRAQVGVTGSTPGTVKLELVVSDGQTDSLPERVTLNVMKGNQAPVAKIATPSLSKLETGQQLTLDGSASNDPDNDKLTYMWKKVDARGDVEFSKADDKFLTVTAIRAGTVKLELVVSDGHMHSAPATYTLTIVRGNKGPVAVIAPPASTKLTIGQQITLDGSGSSDQDRDGLTYKWVKISGEGDVKIGGANRNRATVTAATPGNVTLSLVVNDGTSDSAPAQVSLAVVAPAPQPVVKAPSKPVVKAVASSSRISLSEKATLDGSGSSDPDGGKLTYKWRVIEGRSNVEISGADQAKATLVGSRTGVAKVELVVSNGKVDIVSEPVTVTVFRVNQPPVATIGAHATQVTVGQQITLDASGSTDPDGGKLAYAWKKVGGEGEVKLSHEDRSKVNVTGVAAGTVMLELVVNDGEASSGPAKLSLSVLKSTMPSIPTPKASGSPIPRVAAVTNNMVLVGQSMTLDGSPSSHPDGKKLTYKWRKVDGKGEVELLGAGDAQCKVTAVKPGSVKIELTVSDGVHSVVAESVTLNVTKLNKQPVSQIVALAQSKVMAGASVNLDGSNSTDPDGDRLTYKWRKVSGDAEVKFSRDDRNKVSFTAVTAGTAKIELVVNDGTVDSAPAAVSISIEKAPAPAPEAVKVDEDAKKKEEAKKKEDEAKKAAKEEAKKKEDEAKKAADAKKKEDDAKKAAEAKKKEEDAAKKEEARKAEAAKKEEARKKEEPRKNEDEKKKDEPKEAKKEPVKEPKVNHKPVAAVAALAPVEVGGKIVLDGSGSTDADNDRLTYTWEKVSGPEISKLSNRAKTDTVLAKEGEYVFELKVSDGKESSEPVRVSVKTLAGNAAPKAAVKMAVVRTEEGVETILDASTSSDPDNGPKPLTYIWKGSDSRDLKVEGAIAKYMPKRAGTYSFEVRAFDGRTESVPAQVKVIVAKAGSMPLAVATAKPNPIKKAVRNAANPTVLILDGTKSKAPSGRQLSYVWKQTSGDDLKLKPSDLGKDRVGLLIFTAGVYKFELVVSDGENMSTPAEIEVQVLNE